MRIAAALTTVASAAILASCGGSKPAAPSTSAATVPPTAAGLPSQAPQIAVLPPAPEQLPPAASAGLLAYLEGLDAMMAGKFADATASFSRALETASDDPTFLLARGVAETLAENFPPALADLARVRRLGLRGREAELWTYAAEAMSGTVSPDHQIGGPRNFQDPGRVQSVSIPGHMVQGRDDYSTIYGSVVAYELATPYQQARLPADLGGPGRPDAVNAPDIRAAILKAGQWFAAKYMRRADLAPAHFTRARALHDAQRYEAALQAIDYARASYPDNTDLVYLAANSWLGLGRPATARRLYTLALTGRTDFAAGYLGRAAAAARLGDATRATADLGIADRLDRANTAKVRAAIEADASRLRENTPVDKLLADLDTAAPAAPWDQVLQIAERVHRAAGATRVRYDELYQDTLRSLEDALRANAKSADRYADLARYLIAEADNRGEAVEPRRATEPFRTRVSRERELTRAIQVADLGLAIDSRHAGVLIQKASALTALKRYDDAEVIADRALASSSDNPEALRLYARFRAMRANQFSAEAASLRQDRCSSSSRDEDRGSYIEHITTTTCYPPSPADVARANQLDAAAADLRRRARSAMERAVQVSRGTVGGLLIQADLHLWDGRAQDAQKALQDAVALDPKSVEAQDALVDFYARSGQAERAEEQQAVERQLVHTTAGPLLRLAWPRIGATAWSAATDYLQRARRLDPIDARVPAYLAVVSEGQGKATEATAAYRVALALEEARLRIDEPSGAARPLTRDPLDFGLAMRVRFRLGDALTRVGQPAPALDYYIGNTNVMPRISKADYSRQMFSAILPDERPQGGAVVPAPVNIATLLSQSSLAAARTLTALGRKDDARKQLLVAASFAPAAGRMMPRVGNARGETNFSDQATAGAGEAMVELAKSFLEIGDAEHASQYLQAATNAGIPNNLRNDVNQMQFAIARLLSDRPTNQLPPSTDPMEQRYRNLQQQQDNARARDMYRYATANARVPQELIGSWDLIPENTFLPMRSVLTLEADASFTMTRQRDNRVTRGKATMPSGYRFRNNEGQLVLIAEDGATDVLYYEVESPTQLNLQTQDGNKYKARKR